MVDLFNNEIHIGDKVVFPKSNTHRKIMDYGIVESLSESGKGCFCKSLIYKRGTEKILRHSNQIVKLS